MWELAAKNYPIQQTACDRCDNVVFQIKILKTLITYYKIFVPFAGRNKFVSEGRHVCFEFECLYDLTERLINLIYSL